MIYLSIVIPFLNNDAGSGPAVLRSLLGRSLPEEIEIIVVANPTPVLKGDPRVRWLSTAPVGVGRARNAGVDAARGDWIYFLDADCELPDADHLARVIALARSAPAGTFFGGDYLLADAETATPASKAYHRVQRRWLRSGASSEHGWIHFLGGNLAFPRAAFAEHRFDPAIAFGGSETDVVHRLIFDGYRGVFHSELAVVHRHALTPAELLTKAFLQGRSRARFQRENREIAPEMISHWRAEDDPRVDALVAAYARAFRAGEEGFKSGKSVPGRSSQWWWLHGASLVPEFLRARRARLDRVQTWLHERGPTTNKRG